MFDMSSILSAILRVFQGFDAEEALELSHELDYWFDLFHITGNIYLPPPYPRLLLIFSRIGLSIVKLIQTIRNTATDLYTKAHNIIALTDL